MSWEKRIEQTEKGVKYAEEGLNWLKNKGQVIPNFFGNLMRRIGGGERAVIKVRQASPELTAANTARREAEIGRNLAARKSQEAAQNESALIRKVKKQNSRKNQRRLQKATDQFKKADNEFLLAEQKKVNARNVFNTTKKEVTDAALKQVRNKGIKRLKNTGLVAGLGTGAYLVIPRGSDQSDSSSVAINTPQQYKYDPNKGWQEWNQETEQYEDQQQGFGIDEYGNTNYYDGTNWLTPDQYLQGSNGYIYNKQTGEIIGTADDTTEAQNSGYDSVFDYRAAKAGYNNHEAVKQLQEKLGINADGKWGKQTQDAFDRAASNWAQQYDPNSLFSIYQRKLQFGY